MYSEAWLKTCQPGTPAAPMPLLPENGSGRLCSGAAPGEDGEKLGRIHRPAGSSEQVSPRLSRASLDTSPSRSRVFTFRKKNPMEELGKAEGEAEGHCPSSHASGLSIAVG